MAAMSGGCPWEGKVVGHETGQCPISHGPQARREFPIAGVLRAPVRYCCVRCQPEQWVLADCEEHTRYHDAAEAAARPVPRDFPIRPVPRDFHFTEAAQVHREMKVLANNWRDTIGRPAPEKPRLNVGRLRWDQISKKYSTGDAPEKPRLNVGRLRWHCDGCGHLLPCLACGCRSCAGVSAQDLSQLQDSVDATVARLNGTEPERPEPAPEPERPLAARDYVSPRQAFEAARTEFIRTFTPEGKEAMLEAYAALLAAERREAAETVQRDIDEIVGTGISREFIPDRGTHEHCNEYGIPFRYRGATCTKTCVCYYRDGPGRKPDRHSRPRRKVPILAPAALAAMYTGLAVIVTGLALLSTPVLWAGMGAVLAGLLLWLRK